MDDQMRDVEAAIRDWSPSPSGASSGSQPCGVVARNGASRKAVKWLVFGLGVRGTPLWHLAPKIALGG